jgi:hypothetical protein
VAADAGVRSGFFAVASHQGGHRTQGNCSLIHTLQCRSYAS